MASAWAEVMAALKKTTRPVRLLATSSRDPGTASAERMFLRYWICSLMTSCSLVGSRYVTMMYGMGANVSGSAGSGSIRGGCVGLAGLSVAESGSCLARRWSLLWIVRSCHAS